MSGRKHKAARIEREQPAPAPAAPARARRRMPLLVLALLLAGGGFFWWQRRIEPHAPPKRAWVVPDVPAGEMEPAVREILEESHKNVLVNSGLADAWGWYAAVLDAHEFFAQAEPCYRRAHALAPEDVRYSYNLALLLERVGADPSESLELYRSVARSKPTFPPVHVRIGHNLNRQGKLQEAATAYQAALALDPGLSIARRALARTWIELEQFAKAVADLERVATAVPNDGPTQAALAQAYLGSGDAVRAAAAEERARGLADVLSLPDPLSYLVLQQGRSATLALDRADTRIADNDWAGLVEDLRIVLRTRPSDPQIHERLADAYTRLGKHVQAEQERAEARRLRAAK